MANTHLLIGLLDLSIGGMDPNIGTHGGNPPIQGA